MLKITRAYMVHAKWSGLREHTKLIVSRATRGGPATNAIKVGLTGHIHFKMR